ncbi:aldo/keto reductase [Defluviitalea phaphyphila]|uniref:aldo/keto reductase n=1 Tax=Defluviitalea phaphyphila TaxID=1473580 RepID=UPI000730C87D|nr:aldo/keto reductase [Defluviitalea phaphyphila]
MANSHIEFTIPKLGFGLMRLPMVGEEVDMEQTISMVDYFMEKGFTYFDTAYPYINGKSEVVVREAIVKRYPRESFQLATKMPVLLCKTYKDLEKIFNIQLERTGASYFDFYLLHALNRDRIIHAEKIKAWDFIKDMKKKGFIKHIGFSFHDTAEYLDKVLTSHPETEFVQLQINYADWEDKKIQSRLCYEVARKHNKPIIIMEPVKGGNLASMLPQIQDILKSANPKASIASWALRYAASLDGIITVLSGMSNMEQLIDNINSISNFKPLNEEEKLIIQKVQKELLKIKTIPCTLCQYCVKDCPQSINIPKIISIYNTYKVYNNFEKSRNNYSKLIKKWGKAYECISCKSCESNCPQHIKIIDTLKEAAKQFE